MSTFVEAYDPGFLLSFATALLRPLDVLLRLGKLQLLWSRLSSKLRSSWRTATRSLRLSRIGFVLKLPSTLMRAIAHRFRFPEIGLRLTLEPPRQFGLALDREGVGDLITEHEGAKVLLVAPEVVAQLDEITIDIKDTPEGPKLVISKE